MGGGARGGERGGRACNLVAFKSTKINPPGRVGGLFGYVPVISARLNPVYIGRGE